MGIDLETAKAVLLFTGQYAFSEESVDGQPVLTTTLSATGAANYPAVAEGFSIQIIGESCSVSRLRASIPRDDQAQTAEQGLGALTYFLSATLPADVQFTFLPWLAENYSSLPLAGQGQTTIGNIQFTLQRSPTRMTLELIPLG
jgi:hypothetical protein